MVLILGTARERKPPWALCYPRSNPSIASAVSAYIRVGETRQSVLRLSSSARTDWVRTTSIESKWEPSN